MLHHTHPAQIQLAFALIIQKGRFWVSLSRLRDLNLETVTEERLKPKTKYLMKECCSGYFPTIRATPYLISSFLYFQLQQTNHDFLNGALNTERSKFPLTSPKFSKGEVWLGCKTI